MQSVSKKRLGQQIKIRLSDEIYEWVKTVAKEHERSMCYVISHAVKEFKKQEEQREQETKAV